MRLIVVLGVQPHAQNASPQSRGSIRRIRSIGSEAPLRAAIESGERLLVCASVRYADRTSDDTLWLTDRQFLFTRRQGSSKFLVSVPVTGCTLDFEPGAEYPLRLRWTDEAGAPAMESFRTKAWKDSMDGGSGAATAGATGGVAGAIAVGALEGILRAITGTRGNARRDERLHATLTAALRTPTEVRPVDMTSDSLNSVGSRVLMGFCVAVPTALFLGFGIFAFLGFQSKQAYEQAPICGSAAGTDCRLLQPATVIRFRGSPGGQGSDSYCDLWLRRTDGSTVEADLHTYGLCARQPARPQMSLEYWRGSLTAVIAPGVAPADDAMEETADNPEYGWRFGSAMTGVCGLLWVLFGSLGMVEVVAWWRRHSLLLASARQAGYVA